MYKHMICFLCIKIYVHFQILCIKAKTPQLSSSALNGCVIFIYQQIPTPYQCKHCFDRSQPYFGLEHTREIIWYILIQIVQSDSQQHNDSYYSGISNHPKIIIIMLTEIEKQSYLLQIISTCLTFLLCSYSVYLSYTHVFFIFAHEYT